MKSSCAESDCPAAGESEHEEPARSGSFERDLLEAGRTDTPPAESMQRAAAQLGVALALRAERAPAPDRARAVIGVGAEELAKTPRCGVTPVPARRTRRARGRAVAGRQLTMPMVPALAKYAIGGLLAGLVVVAGIQAYRLLVATPPVASAPDVEAVEAPLPAPPADDEPQPRDPVREVEPKGEPPEVAPVAPAGQAPRQRAPSLAEF